MKIQKLLIVCLITVTSVFVQAADDGYGQLVTKWTSQRDALVQRILRSWLHGATPKSLQGDVATLVSLEIRLATDGTVPLYMTHFKDSAQPERVLSDLVSAFLVKGGVEIQTPGFFRGKEFKVLREERPHLEQVGSSADFRFQKWSDENKSDATKKGTAYE